MKVRPTAAEASRLDVIRAVEQRSDAIVGDNL